MTRQLFRQFAETEVKPLCLPNISYAEEIRVEGNCVIVKRQYEDRYHVLKAKMPCLITALSELNQPRYMTPGGILDAYRNKEVTILTRADLDVEDCNIGLKGSPTRVFKSFTKEVKGKGTVVKMDPAEAAAWLAGQLKEKHII